MENEELSSYGNQLKYKGYHGGIKYDGESNILFGEVVNTNGTITYTGMSIEEIRQSFVDSIDAYLEFCDKIGEDPEKIKTK